jgi:hypothetical protein
MIKSESKEMNEWNSFSFSHIPSFHFRISVSEQECVHFASSSPPAISDKRFVSVLCGRYSHFASLVFWSFRFSGFFEMKDGIKLNVKPGTRRLLRF